MPSYKWISGNTLYIKTASTMLSSSYYTVYVPNGAVKDAAGNNGIGYYFRFKTAYARAAQSVVRVTR